MSNQIVVDILADTKNLVAGIDNTNSKLNSLSGQVSKINAAFAGVTAIFGARLGINWWKDTIDAARKDELAFKQLADTFGTDFAGVSKQVGDLAKKWYVDDGDVAGYFVKLATSIRANFRPLTDELVAGSLAISKATGKPVDEILTLWSKVLRDGQITQQEFLRLGITLTAEQEDQFKKLKTGYEQVKFLLDIINGPAYQKKALDNIPPYEKWNREVNNLRESIGAFVNDQLNSLYKKMLDLPGPIGAAAQGFVVFGSAALATLGTFAPAILAVIELSRVMKGFSIATAAAAAAQGLLNLVFSPWLVIVAAVILAGVLLYKNWDKVTEAAGWLWDKVKQLFNWVKENWPLILGFLTGPIGAAVSFIIRNFDSIKSGIANAFNGIKSIFGGLISDFTNLGRNIIQGLVNGIRAMASAPLDALKSIGTGAVNLFKSIFKIGSPSKLFDSYGRFIVQGLSNGIGAAQGLAENAMQGLSSNLSPTFALSGAAYNTGTQSPVNITINAGVGTDPYELGRVVSAALNKYNGVNGVR